NRVIEVERLLVGRSLNIEFDSECRLSGSRYNVARHLQFRSRLLMLAPCRHLLSLAEMPICLQHVSGCLRRLVYASVDSFKQAIHLLALGFAGLSVRLCSRTKYD